MQIVMEPIGYVQNEVKDKKDGAWGDDNSSIVLEKNFISGLKGLEDFSHVIILYIPREKPHTGAAAREQPRDSPVIER